jgi:hypothetical protein
MTKFEKMYESLQRIGLAMNRAKNESVANMWWLRYQQLEYRLSQMTIKEAIQEV